MIDDNILDSEDFDPIDFINRRFPTEGSLDDLDTFTLGLSSQMSALDEELSKAVQSQTASGEQSSKEVAEAQKSIEELFEKISDIKLKASQSERMVQEICSDIKKLDYAKTHLQTSITALKRIQMLTTAISQLSALIGDPSSYRDVANLLDATTQIMKYFENYGAIPIIATTKQQLEQLQQDLRRHVTKIFRELGQLVDEGMIIGDESSSGGLSTLSDSCLIVDALGYTFRQELLEEFVQLQLVPYEKLFGPEKQHFALDQVERRWAWFKRLLKTFDQKYSSLFPTHWKVPLRLALEFFERTKIHITQLLTMMESKGTSDVHSLLKSLQTTLRFETEMSQRFDIKSLQGFDSDVMNNSKQSSNAKIASDERLKADGKLMYVPTFEQNISREERDDEHFIKLAVSALAGGISNVFDKFLGSYVLLERSNLEELIQKLSQEEDTAAEATSSGLASVSDGNIFGSSMSMFVFIKNSIKRCTALTCGQTLLALTKEFKTCLLQYIELLRSRCPNPIIIASSLPNLSIQSSTLGPPIYRLPIGGEVGICHIINTGEYCAEVVPQLEQMIKAKIVSTLVDKVDLSHEVDAFNDLVAFALKVLVSALMDRLESAFKSMSGVSWGNMTQVGEESAYCIQIATTLQESIPRIRDALSSSFFNNFCAKLATELLQRYQDTITKQKRISEMGSQQLLLDTYNLKTLLLKLHILTPLSESNSSTLRNTSSSAPQMYLKIVTQRVTHIEAMLKLIGTPEEVLVERFRVLWPDGGPTDLQLLMSLKGMKRSDQQTFLEGLGLGIGNATTATATASSTVGSVVGTAGSVVGTAAAFTSQASYSIASSARSGISVVGSMSSYSFMNKKDNK